VELQVGARIGRISRTRHSTIAGVFILAFVRKGVFTVSIFRDVVKTITKTLAG
jgi:hypothetical protein